MFVSLSSFGYDACMEGKRPWFDSWWWRVLISPDFSDNVINICIYEYTIQTIG